MRQTRSNVAHNMARSLPVSVPLPEGLPKRGELFDIPSDEDDEDGDIEGKYIKFLALSVSIVPRNQLKAKPPLKYTKCLCLNF